MKKRLRPSQILILDNTDVATLVAPEGDLTNSSAWSDSEVSVLNQCAQDTGKVTRRSLRLTRRGLGIGAISAERADFAARFQQLSAENAELRKWATWSETAMLKLEQEKAGVSANLDRLAQENSQLGNEVIDLLAQLEQSAIETGTLMREIVVLEEYQQTARKTTEDLTMEMEELRVSLLRSESLREGLIAERAGLVAKACELGSEKSRREHDISSLSELISQLIADKERLEGEKADQALRAERSKRRISHLEHEPKASAQENDEFPTMAISSRIQVAERLESSPPLTQLIDELKELATLLQDFLPTSSDLNHAADSSRTMPGTTSPSEPANTSVFRLPLGDSLKATSSRVVGKFPRSETPRDSLKATSSRVVGKFPGCTPPRTQFGLPQSPHHRPKHGQP